MGKEYFFFNGKFYDNKYDQSWDNAQKNYDSDTSYIRKKKCYKPIYGSSYVDNSVNKIYGKSLAYIDSYNNNKYYYCPYDINGSNYENITTNFRGKKIPGSLIYGSTEGVQKLSPSKIKERDNDTYKKNNTTKVYTSSHSKTSEYNYKNYPNKLKIDKAKRIGGKYIYVDKKNSKGENVQYIYPQVSDKLDFDVKIDDDDFYNGFYSYCPKDYKLKIFKIPYVKDGGIGTVTSRGCYKDIQNDNWIIGKDNTSLGCSKKYSNKNFNIHKNKRFGCNSDQEKVKVGNYSFCKDKYKKNCHMYMDEEENIHSCNQGEKYDKWINDKNKYIYNSSQYNLNNPTYYSDGEYKCHYCNNENIKQIDGMKICCPDKNMKPQMYDTYDTNGKKTRYYKCTKENDKFGKWMYGNKDNKNNLLNQKPSVKECRENPIHSKNIKNIGIVYGCTNDVDKNGYILETNDDLRICDENEKLKFIYDDKYNDKYKYSCKKCPNNQFYINKKAKENKDIKNFGYVNKCCNKSDDYLFKNNKHKYMCCAKNSNISNWINDDNISTTYTCKECQNNLQKTSYIDEYTGIKYDKCCNKNNYVIKNKKNKYKCCLNNSKTGYWVNDNDKIEYDCRTCPNNKKEILYDKENGKKIYKCCDNSTDILIKNYNNQYKCCENGYTIGYWADDNTNISKYTCKKCPNNKVLNTYNDNDNNKIIYGCCDGEQKLMKKNGKYVCANYGKWLEEDSKSTWLYCDQNNNKIMKNLNNEQKCCKKNEYLCSDNNCKSIHENYIDNKLICYNKKSFYYDEIYGYKSKDKYFKYDNVLYNTNDYTIINDKILAIHNIYKINNTQKDEYVLLMGKHKKTMPVKNLINEILLNINIK
jgi:hypothetical protein